MTDTLTHLGIDASAWPDWLLSMAGFAWIAGTVLLAAALAWLLAFLLSRLIRLIGQRVTKREDIDGSVWDFSSTLLGLFIIVAGVAIGLQSVGVRAFEFLGGYGTPLIRAVIIFAIAWFVASLVARSVRRFGERLKTARRTDNTLFNFLASVVRYALLAIAVIIALQQFGFQITSLAAVIGAAALAIGLALQDTLKAVAAGVMLAVFRPYRIGDWITIAEAEGEVTDITPFTTTIAPPDNKSVIVPNDKAWGNVIVNSTGNTRRRIDLVFDASYEDDVDHVLNTLRQTFEADPRVLQPNGVWVGVWAYADWSIRYRVRAWCATTDFFQLRADLMRAVKYAFDDADIMIPYPHQVEFGIQPDAEGRPNIRKSHGSDKDVTEPEKED